MMKLRAFIATLALATSWPAVAEIQTLVSAVETTAANLRLPVSNNGRLSFKSCDTSCDEDFVVVRLTPATHFVVRGATVEYLDFRKAFYGLSSRGKEYALVRYDVRNNTATSVQIGF